MCCHLSFSPNPNRLDPSTFISLHIFHILLDLWNPGFISSKLEVWVRFTNFEKNLVQEVILDKFNKIRDAVIKVLEQESERVYAWYKFNNTQQRDRVDFNFHAETDEGECMGFD